MRAAERDKLIKKVYEMNEKQKKLDKELKLLKSQLKEKVKPGQYGDFLVAIEERERESFSLKEAKAKVSKAVWEKIKGFVNTSSYESLKIVRAK